MMEVAKSTRVVYEVDDNFIDLPESNLAHGLYGPGCPGTKVAQKAMLLADAVTTATDSLAKRYADFNSNISVCPNAIPDESFARYAKRRITNETRRPKEIRIGWSGAGDFHQADLALLHDPLMRILRAYPQVNLVFSGARPWTRFAGFGDRIHYEPIVLSDALQHPTNEAAVIENLNREERFYAHLDSLDFDIAVAPIESNAFNDCKSDLKILTHGFLGIPMVVSRWGPYERYAKEKGASVLLADSANEWEREMRRLIEDGNLRAKIAQENRDHIGRTHLLSHVIKSWESVYKELMRKPKSVFVPQEAPLPVLAARRPARWKRGQIA